jgi:putative ABC transport system substrate-binding protein
MKKSVKTIIAAALALVMIFALAGCASPAAQDTGAASPAAASTAQESASAEQETASASSGETAAAGNVTVGVIQYATHPSLDNCYTGFLQGLEEAGFKEGENLTIDFQNAQGDMANSDMIAKNMVSKKESLIMGIATPAAMSAYAATKNEGLPVVFSAVSDPVAAGIVKSVESTETNCTGTSDVLNLEAQMKMIRAFLPDAKKIGIIYTTSEPNSISHLEKFKALAPTYGFEIVEVGVTNASEVASAAASVVGKGVDCINNFTDNNVVDNLASVVQAANKAKIPVFGSEVEQVKNGCLASESIDYVSLGRETGKIAAEILNGKKPSDIPVALISDTTPVFNQEVLDTLGLTLPADYANAQAVSK